MIPMCTEETCIEAGKRKVHVTIDGRDVPIGGFVQGFLLNTILAMLGSLKKVDIQEGSEIEIQLKVKK
ncbi:MAG: hypothetical protein ACC644_03410 [Candidatus Hydrothermarchaeales archaeon]